MQTLYNLIKDAEQHLSSREKWEPFIRHCLNLIEDDYNKYCRDADREALEQAFDLVSDADESMSDSDDSEYDSADDEVPLVQLYKK